MANSYLNILTFLLTTLFYYMILKPNLDYKTVSNGELYKSYTTTNYVSLAVYLLLVMVIQFIVNSSIIAQSCGGSISENMGAAGMLTFIPWTLIFGVTIVILVIYPGFKSAFSDVIGYYWISNQANDLLVELLVQQNVEDSLAKGTTPAATASASYASTDDDDNDNAPSAPPASAFSTPSKDTSVGGKNTSQKGGDNKQAIREVADLILKLCGNTSILINQMTPRNFEPYWSLLTPLKKPKYQNDTATETQALKKQLFDLTVTRDNIGETLWYVYTGLLLTSVVQLKIATRGCSTNPKIMEENYAKFQQQEAAIQAQNAATTNTTYTITN
jgi:hypothetical protein